MQKERRMFDQWGAFYLSGLSEVREKRQDCRPTSSSEPVLKEDSEMIKLVEMISRMEAFQGSLDSKDVDECATIILSLDLPQEVGDTLSARTEKLYEKCASSSGI
jgi:hypothetical protein